MPLKSERSLPTTSNCPAPVNRGDSQQLDNDRYDSLTAIRLLACEGWSLTSDSSI